MAVAVEWDDSEDDGLPETTAGLIKQFRAMSKRAAPIPSWAEKAYDEPEEEWATSDSDDDAERSPKSRYYDMDSIAIDIMRELVASGHEDLLLIKNPEVGAWWGDVMAQEKRIADAFRRKEEQRAKAEFDARAKAELINRLTPEEKRLLGIR